MSKVTGGETVRSKQVAQLNWGVNVNTTNIFLLLEEQ